MAVVIDEITTEPTAQSEPRREAPREQTPPEAHEIERVLCERHERLARVRAH